MKTPQERFEEKFTKADGCWEWTACRDKWGYGRLQFSEKMQGAHRVAYQLYVGEIPDGLCVLHHCDNPSCVRPDHLFLGTNDDNVRDRDGKGRGAIGEKNGSAKLTEEQVKTIRSKRKEGAHTIDLAKQFGVAQRTISKIVLYQKWAKI